MRHLPTIGKLALLVPNAGFDTPSLEPRIGGLPQPRLAPPRVVGRRRRPVEHIRAKPLQFPPLAEVEQCVLIRMEHGRSVLLIATSLRRRSRTLNGRAFQRLARSATTM